jgi:anion-transporting  ArsA/GET3 family ATPase
MREWGVRRVRRDAIVDELKAMDRRSEECHERLLERSRASERIFIVAMTEIDASLKRNTERLDDMGEAIRANTRAVLSVLDRLGRAGA